MKTLSMFLRASKTEAEEAGIETEGMATSVSKLRDEILSLTKVNGGSGVDIMLDEDTYKSTYQILKELSLVWEDLSDVTQANILERIAGKRNANIAASVITNFSVAEEALATSTNSAGSALKENEKYLDSIAGHMSKVTIEFEKLSQRIIESDYVKAGADALKGVLAVLNGILDVLGAFPTTLGAIAMSLSGIKNIGFITRVNTELDTSGRLIDRVTNGIRIFGKSFKDIANDTRAYGNIFDGLFSRKLTDGDKNALKDYQNALTNALKTTKVSENGVNKFDIDGFDNALKGSELRLAGLSVAGKETAASMKDLAVQFGNGKITSQQFNAQINGLTTAQKASKASTFALTAATVALNAAISLGIGLLVNLVVEGFNRAINGLSQAVSKVDELASTVKDSQSEWKSLNDELATTKKRISELSDVESPTLFEQDELNRLKEYNDELERRIKLLEYENIVKADEYNKAAQEAWATLTGTSFWSGALSNPVLFQQNDISYYKKLLDEYKQVKEDYSNGLIDPENYESLQDIYERKIKEYHNKLANYRSQYSKILLGLNPDDPNNETAINYLNDLTNQIDTLFGDISSYGSTFEEIWNNAEFATITNDLSELAKQGKLTEDTFNNVSGIEEFKQALESIGLTDIAEVIDTITRSVNDNADAFKNAAGNYDEYIANIAELKKSYDDIASKQKVLQSAYDKINSGTALTSTEFLELLEIYPQLYDSFTRVEEGYTLTADSIIAANSHINESLRQSVDQQIEDLRRARSAYESWRRDNEDTSGSSVDSLISSIGGLFNGENNWGEIFETGSQLIQNSFNKVEPPITEDVYNQYGEQINYLTVLLDSLNISTKATSDEIEDFGTVLKEYSSNVSLGVSAQKEMNEGGKLSASTIESMLALGTDYVKCLQFENGVIKLNTKAFKEVTKAKLKDKVAELELAKAEAIRIRIEDAYNGNEHWKELEADIADVNLQLQIAKSLYDNFESDWESAFDDKGPDTTDSDYKKRLEKIKEANKGTIESEKQFVNSWKALNEEMYKATDPEKYEENLKEISDYIKGLDSLLDTYLEKWGKVNNYDENDIVSRITRLAEAHSVNYETYGNPNSLFYNLDTYEKNEASLFGYEADTAKLRYDRGLIEYQDFINDVKRIRESARDRDGNYLLDMSFVSNYEDLDKYFNERLEVLKSFNDKSLDDEDDFVRQWKALNDEIYQGVDNTKYENNLKEILNYEKDLLDRRRKEGLISYEDYRKGLIKLQNDNDALLGEDVLNEWLVSAANSEKEELDRLYKEGKTLAKDYFDYVCALIKENEDILDQRTIEEWTKDAWKSRAETEKTYWEQQKELAAQYYDAEIKALQDVQKEEEKISKAEELRLNLIKARQKLEEAKSQNNQLVFYNGEFEYMADQDAIMSAEEEVAESLKAIKENELQEQIDLLEQQKDEALLFYSNIIGMLDYYINETTQIKSSDETLLSKAMRSDSGQYYLKLFNGEISPDEIREGLKSTFTPKSENDSTNNESSNSMVTWARKVLDHDVADIFNIVSDLAAVAKVAEAFSNIGTSAQDILKFAAENIVNKNETEINQSVNVGDIHMTIQGDTSQSMIDQFARQLGSAIQASAQLYAF